MPWARRIAVVVAVLTALHVVVAVGFATQASTGTAWGSVGLGLAVVPACSALSILIVRRPDGAVVGDLLGLLALTISHVVAKEAWLQWLGTSGRPEQQAWLVAVTAENAWWVLGSFSLLLLYFPDGRLPSRRWVWVPPALVLCVVSVQTYGAFDPGPYRPPVQHLEHPFGDPPVAIDLLSALFFPMLGLFVACAVSLLLRYRRSDRVRRQQIKWLALTGIGLPLYPLLCGLEILVWGHPLWFSTTIGLASLVATPIAAGIAVLRYDLFDVDKALAFAVTWSVLTTLLLGTYAVVSSIVGVAVGRDSTAGAALGTAAAAVALLPALRTVRGAVDARLYPLRRAALTAVDELHRQVSAGQARPEELESRLRGALRDPTLRVGFRVPGGGACLDESGSPVPAADGVAVLLDGERTGVVVPGSGPASAELLSEVAGRCSTLVEVVRLRAQVADALRKAESSRTRLVEIGYEERRRMERDLHDGAQQRLVSLGMNLRLAQRHLDDGSVDVDELLDASVAELATAVVELRQIAHGLRPSSLDDGLPAALSNLVRSVPMAVDMDVDDGPLTDAVATTAYYIASEAITNAVKHAQATKIILQVVRRDGLLLVRVTDDGRGGANLGVRSGLSDRVAALGGSLRVASPDGQGTEVEATLPCAS
ncbi:MAG TPA: sensor histidine kinase [Microlunatus sp.]|nr:sensor histidine kinase [Microlunatus sp.]